MEEAVVFTCGKSRLVGILHRPKEQSKLGVLIVTGGPQYRIGSHRQFLLLARSYAGAGFPTFRFDHRGTGDSEGSFEGFERIDEDISAAITAFMDRVAGVERIVLWGLCDAASAILLYAARDPRIAALMLINPWVREEQGEARALVKHYYGRRVLEPEFWRKLLSGRVAISAAVQGLSAGAAKWLRSEVSARQRGAENAADPLPLRMAHGLAAFRGPVGLVLSGRDLTAREFDDAADSAIWRSLLAKPRVSIFRLPEADHTFSRRLWRDAVCRWSLEWLARIES